MRDFLNKIVSAIFGGVGRNIAEMALGLAFAAYQRAEAVTLTTAEEKAAKDKKEGDEDDARAVKQALREKKRKAAIADIKSGLGFVDAVVPDSLIAFVIEIVALADNLGLARQIRSVVK